MPSWLTAVSHRHGQQTKWVCHTNIQQPTNTLECYVLVACGQLATQHINFRDPPKDTSSTVAAGVQLRLQLPLDKNTCQSLWTVQGKTDTTTDLKFPPTANLNRCVNRLLRWPINWKNWCGNIWHSSPLMKKREHKPFWMWNVTRLLFNPLNTSTYPRHSETSLKCVEELQTKAGWRLLWNPDGLRPRQRPRSQTCSS